MNTELWEPSEDVIIVPDGVREGFHAKKFTDPIFSSNVA